MAKFPLPALSDLSTAHVGRAAERIAILIYSLQAGGAERVTATMANEWARHGKAVTIATISAEPDFYALHPAVNRVRLAIARSTTGALEALAANVGRIRALRRFLRTESPDVLICMMTGSAVLGIVAATGLGIRVVASERIHPPAQPVGPMWELARRLTYPRAHAVVVLADESARWIDSHVKGSRVAVIPNPVVLPLPTIEPRIAPGGIVSPATRVLLAVGRLAPQKGYDVLLDAFARLGSQFSNWNLVILGDGPCRDALSDQANRLGLAKQVRFLGQVGNIADWYMRADVFVLSSRFEGFPNVLVEAMAHGCPAVSFDCETGPRDIIRPGIDGLLVRPPGDVAALSDALRTIMGNDDLRNGFAARCEEVAERFSLERLMKAWDALVGEP